MRIEPWMRDVHASGSVLSSGFQGPGSVATSVTFGSVKGIHDPRFVVLYERDNGERVSLPYVIERADGVLSGFDFLVRREALGPTALEITVERTGPGAEPSHIFTWFMLRGPEAPKELPPER